MYLWLVFSQQKALFLRGIQSRPDSILARWLSSRRNGMRHALPYLLWYRDKAPPTPQQQSPSLRHAGRSNRNCRPSQRGSGVAGTPDRRITLECLWACIHSWLHGFSETNDDRHNRAPWTAALLVSRNCPSFIHLIMHPKASTPNALQSDAIILLVHSTQPVKTRCFSGGTSVLQATGPSVRDAHRCGSPPPSSKAYTVGDWPSKKRCRL